MDEPITAAAPSPAPSSEISQGTPTPATPATPEATPPAQPTPSKPSQEPQAHGEPPLSEELTLAAQLTKALVKDAKAEPPPAVPEEKPPGAEEPPPDPNATRYAIPSSSTFKGNHELRKAFVEKVELLKQADQQLAQSTQMVTSFREKVREIGATPEQVQASFGYLALLNQGKLQEALKVIDHQRAEIAKQLGVALPGVDYNPLAEFPDLQAKLDDLSLTEEAALEVAKARLDKQRAEEAAAQRQQGQERVQQQFQMRERCHQQMMEAIADLAANDLDYPMLDEALADYIEKSDFMANVPPQFWANNLKTVYNSLKAGMAKLGKPTGVNPLRPRAPEGGGEGRVAEAEPKTLHEAISRRFGP
jgi:hypothetical protein